MQHVASTNSSKPTFAEKTAGKIQPLINFEHPTEEQGIIFSHIEGTKIHDYLVTIHQLVGGAANIVAASQVSGGRVIIFLAKKETVDYFQLNYDGFQLNQTFIKTRKLKTPAQKLILSNVSPIVTNTALEKALKEDLKLKLVSPVSILRVSPKDNLFPHVVCWRRQVYVHPSDEKNDLPSAFTLTFAERSYRIFLNTDSLTCFKCGSKGHKAEDCNQLIEEENEDIYDTPTHTSPTAQNISNLDFPPLTPAQTTENMAAILRTTQQPKRGPSTLNSSIPSITNDNTLGSQNSTHKPTKLVQMGTGLHQNQAKRIKTTEILKPSSKSCSSLNFVQKSPRGQMSIFTWSGARGLENFIWLKYYIYRNSKKYIPFSAQLCQKYAS